MVVMAKSICNCATEGEAVSDLAAESPCRFSDAVYLIEIAKYLLAR